MIILSFLSVIEIQQCY